MSEFLDALQHLEFLRNGLWAALLGSIACGIIGSFVVVRRITYLAGGIAHCVLGGMGAAIYLQTVYHLSWMHPLLGAVFAALLAALIIGWITLRSKERADTAIGALWAIGMALGALFLSMTPGNIDLMSYLFGNILYVTRYDLWYLVTLDALILLGTFLFYHQFMAICFDEEFATLRGIHVGFYHLLLLCLVALTVVLLTTIVGIVMVIALLTLPAATASRFSKNLWQMMLLSIAFCAIFSILGMVVSYELSSDNGPQIPTGTTIILIAGIVYLLSLVSNPAVRLLKKFFRSSATAPIQ